MKLGYIHLTLHGHVPFVLNHGTWPHGEVWLQEIVWETYIPLLELLHEYRVSKLPIKLTLNLSPILLEQISNQRFIKNFEDYINEQIKYAKREEEEYRTREPIRSNLAKYWISIYEKRKQFFENLDGIVSSFKKFAEDGLIEIISCAATHGYLPLLGYDECVESQVKIGLMTSRKHFSGLDIKGFWLPECAYRSSYKWTNPITGETLFRKGLEIILYDNRITFSYTDYHLLVGQEKVGIVESPYESKSWDSLEKREKICKADQDYKKLIPLKPYYCISPGYEKGIVFLIRDPIGTSRVWSRDMGFPGNGRYLEFHKRAFPGGHRFWRVTDKKLGLGAKEFYEPLKALEAINEHATLFVNMLQDRSKEALLNFNLRPLFVEVFDAELFGHWWHEGILWLKEVFKLINLNGLIEPLFGREILEIYEKIEITHLWEGSWGAGGDHRIWLNEETKWMWNKIYECEKKMIDELSPMEPKNDIHLLALNQAAKELLLLEASDWEFLYTTWQARDYAEQRFQRHYSNFIKTYELAKALNKGIHPEEGKIEEIMRIARDDDIFEGVDYKLWRKKK
ncbi:MAG: DUF1957 domain-containing protein [Synergistetes bacterium]|nr:DUF1957 domain-containing protein [Synergistota bacterium]MCX8127822.1 DUF1957 domain-containing protein [Synergistota bacterium]MDW8192084.1 DUF1957 domain-containing protein [Synergistota bacterium]